VGPRLASSDLVLRAAIQGQGVALARHRLPAADVASGALVRPFGELRIVLPDNPHLRPATVMAVEWLKKQARSLPGG
jgi:LysR family glycine cleavage system transcriptional activator